MKNGFVKVACGAPTVHVADTVKNTDELIRLTKEADANGAALIVYPELCITGSTCGDLFMNTMLIESASAELNRYLKETQNASVVSVVGLPLAENGKLYNCAVVCQKGVVLGLVSKTALSDKEARWFTSVPLATSCIFKCDELPNFRFAVTFGHSHSAESINGDATVICNPTASFETAMASTVRRELCKTYTLQNHCCLLYATCAMGESTTDTVYSGHRMIFECGELLAEVAPFACGTEILYTEIDVDKAAREQLLNRKQLASPTTVQYCGFSIPKRITELTRTVSAHPFFPADKDALANHCDMILNIQAHGLKQRIEKAYAKKVVIGISGGLDSTLALLVAVKAMDLLGSPRTDVLAVTMPCFGTTDRTKNNATVLCEELGVAFQCVNIADAVNQHFADIGHDPDLHDVTYENSQARERTQVLMDIANGCGGMVIGTGDLSELALGWATYNGDQMSMYGVNADVPKTLIRHIVAHYSAQAKRDGKQTLADALLDILETPVSPELLPANEQGEIAQKTEDLVGPYELHDFYLYHLLRNGFSPEKLYRLAKKAFGTTYSDQTLLHWLEVFLRRFFNQQFKRSCMPDGPAVCEIGLSPREFWKMPSDASSAIWLEEVKRIKESN